MTSLLSPFFCTVQTTLDQVDMEDDMKMLVSDEIKRFRESYQVCASPLSHTSHPTPSSHLIMYTCLTHTHTHTHTRSGIHVAWLILALL